MPVACDTATPVFRALSAIPLRPLSEISSPPGVFTKRETLVLPPIPFFILPGPRKRVHPFRPPPISSGRGALGVNTLRFGRLRLSMPVQTAYLSSWSTPCGCAFACASMACAACSRMLFLVYSIISSAKSTSRTRDSAACRFSLVVAMLLAACSS